MNTVDGGNNPHNSMHVDSKGRGNTFAVTVSEQQEASARANVFNVNTGEVTLTDDLETPFFYIKNTGEDKPLKISRQFVSMMSSTGGSGPVRVNIYYNPTAGTVLSGAEMPIYNFVVGSGNTLDIDVRAGVSGDTFTATEAPIKSLFTADNFRSLTIFDHIIIPRGQSVLFTVQPPAGNTSVIVEAGVNLFLEESER